MVTKRNRRSGSTLVAGERRGRRARLMEIGRKYADCIVRRPQPEEMTMLGVVPMTNLRRRLKTLEELFTGPAGLAHTQKWLEYRDRQFYLYLSGQDDKAIRNCSLEALRTLMHDCDNPNYLELKNTSGWISHEQLHQSSHRTGWRRRHVRLAGICSRSVEGRSREPAPVTGRAIF
jgi:hypothetical protein